MSDAFKAFHVLAFNDGTVRAILAAVLLLVVASLVVEQRLLMATAEFQKVCLRESMHSHLTGYMVLCVVSEANGLLVDWLAAILRYRLGRIADSLFTSAMLDSDVEMLEREQPGAYLETYKIKKTALLNFYEYSVCVIPKYLLQFLHAIYQVSVRSSDKLNPLISALFVTALSLYFASFSCFLIIRKRIRVRINHSSLQKAARIERSFRSFDCIKALGLEMAVAQKYQLLVRMHFMLVDIYHLASEFFRLLMRSTTAIAEICTISSIYLGLGVVEPTDAYAVLLWIKSIDRSLLNLRNVLAMHLEYKHEASLKSPSAAEAFGLRQRQHPGYSNSRLALVSSGARSLLSVRPRQLQTRPSSCSEIVHFYHTRPDPACPLHFESGISFFDVSAPISRAAALSYAAGATAAFHKACDGTALDSPGPYIVALPNIKIPPRQVTCIIGADIPTKNAIADCLLGMVEYAGRIETGGQELRHIYRHTKLRASSYLPDRQELFCKSVIFNISYGSGLSEAQAIHKANELGFGRSLSGLAEGYHTPVNDNGCGLSSGERQLICICRALIKDCPLYILDNPASFLDKDHREAVFGAISSMKAKIVIVFSPDDTLAGKFDNTVVLSPSGSTSA